MKDEWYTVDLRKLEFSSDFFSVVEKWLPAIANVGIRRLIAFSIYSHTKSAIQEFTNSNSIFESFAEVNWKNLNALIESQDFINFSKKLISISSKIGQLVILESCLSKIIEESLHQRIETVIHATENLIESITVDKREGLKLDPKTLEHAQDFIAMMERLGLSKKLLKKKNNVPHFAGIAIFSVLVHYLLTGKIFIICNFTNSYRDDFEIIFSDNE